MKSDQEHFWDHIEALRATLIRVLATVGLAMLLALCFYRPLMHLLLSPLENGAIKTESISQIKITNTSQSTVQYHIAQENRVVEILPSQSITVTQIDPPRLAIFSPAEGLMTLLKVCLWVGLAASSPIWFYWIYLFIAPAMHAHEKRVFIPFTLISIAFFFLGGAFSYYVTIPMANDYLNAFNAQIGMNLWGLSHYLNYTLILLLSNAIAFELCVLLLFLVHFGKVSVHFLRRHRSAAIICIFILSALITPPDVLTQCMLAVPLVGFYELGILYARFRHRHDDDLEVIQISDC